MRSVPGRRVLLAVGVALGTVGVVGIALYVYLRIRYGKADEVFQNGYGQYETWASYAGLLAVAPVVLLGMWFVRWVQLWRRSRLEGIPMKKLLEELKRHV